VKLIYIDPPYNTGKDFVYPDNFQDNIKNYLELTGQTGEGGKKLSSNTEASGRFHTDWLNMMYPRLKLARNLLREDGVIFVSIDDNEIANLKAICDEVFHEENIVGIFKWNRVAKAPSLSGSIRSKYEYVIAYFKNTKQKLFGKESYNTQGPLWHLPNKRNELLFPRKSISVKESYFKGNYGGTYNVELLDDLIEDSGFNKDAVRILAHSAWGQQKIDDYVQEGNTFEIKKNPTTVYTTLSSEGNYIAPSDLITKAECGVGTNTEASDALKSLDIPFDYPKPVALIQYFLKMATHEDKSAIVLDFFSGSAASAHAAMQLNAEDGGMRRYVMVQLPEICDEKSHAAKAGYKTIAELTKERLRRAGKKIKAENPLFAGDLGFRVFKLASSNIRTWEPDRDKLAETLEASIDHLKTDRTEQDILFELLLKLGLDLCVPIEKKQIEGANKQTHELHSIGGGSLLVCLSPSIPQADVEPLALGLVTWHKALKPAGETTVVFRDSAFADDVAKTNLTAILHQHGLETVRSL
jgi:adenine-specific DNA-methyltransferase